MTDATGTNADEGFGPRNVSEAVDDFTGRAIPNRVQPGTFGPVFDAGVEEGKRQARHATPNRVANLANVLRSALNEFEKDGQKYQRFSTGGRDTATVMAEYILRNWNPYA
jgi:hypothetical protein